jgi:hypothetical protein
MVVDRDKYAQTLTIEALPEELLGMILKILKLSLGEGKWNAPALVCRKWRHLFDDGNFLKLLKKGEFPLLSDRSILISSLAKNIQTFEKIDAALGPWMDSLIRNCCDDSGAIFILENMWLTSFDSSFSCPSSKIEDVLKTVRQLNIATYQPNQHLCCIVAKEKLSEKTLKEALRLGYSLLNCIPECQKTTAICLAAIRQNGWAIVDVPENIRTPESYLAAVQRVGMVLCDVPENLRSAEICWAAVQQDGEALQYVPVNLITDKVCLSAVQQSGLALEYVPENLKTTEICLIALQQYREVFKYVPDKLITVEFCFAYVQLSGWALEHVPENLKISEICMAAVQQNGFALKYIPENQRTFEICIAAVQENRQAFVYVPVNQRNFVINLAVNKNLRS